MQKISSKCTEDLNVRFEIIILLEENIRNTLFDIDLGNILLDLLL